MTWSPRNDVGQRFSGKTLPDVISISVGNIAFGGRGKTPTVALVTRTLLAMGERPAILSRGYGRRHQVDGVVVVSDGRHLLADLDRSGDEPLMLARQIPDSIVLVCDQRAVAGALAHHAFGATALVLDDGFQHRQMGRHLDLVIVAPDDLTGRRAPFGRLREPVSALRRADAVAIDAGAENDVGQHFSGKTLPDVVFRLRRHTAAPDLPAGAPVFVVAGIAGPERFVRAVEAAGLVVAGHWLPGDHAPVAARDIARIERDARAAGAVALVTTAKDAERLRPFRPLPFDVHVMAHEVELAPVEGGPTFAAWLAERVTTHRHQRRAGAVA